MEYWLPGLVIVASLITILVIFVRNIAVNPVTEPVAEEKELLFTNRVVEVNKTFTYAQYLKLTSDVETFRKRLIELEDSKSRQLACLQGRLYHFQSLLKRSKKVAEHRKVFYKQMTSEYSTEIKKVKESFESLNNWNSIYIR